MTPEHADAVLEIVLPGAGVPVHGLGGVYVKVNPEAGNTVELKVIEAVLDKPAVVADQEVKLVLLLKFALVAPLNPT